MTQYRARVISEEQLAIDTALVTKLIDDLGSAAMNISSNGAMGYQQFIEVREEFRALICSFKNQYNIVTLN